MLLTYTGHNKLVEVTTIYASLHFVNQTVYVYCQQAYNTTVCHRVYHSTDYTTYRQSATPFNNVMPIENKVLTTIKY